VFDVRVIPLTLRSPPPSQPPPPPVTLLQGDLAAPLNASHLPLETNGDRGGVRYNLTRPFSFGRLYVLDSPTQHFSLSDLEAGMCALGAGTLALQSVRMHWGRYVCTRDWYTCTPVSKDALEAVRMQWGKT